MMPFATEAGEALRFAGDAYARGRAQAALCPALVDHVRHAVAARLDETSAALARPDVRDFIDAQRAVTRRLYPEILEEIRGIADGFGLGANTVFEYLHCSSAMDLASLAEHRPDGCTALAASAAGGPALVAKNRDYRAEHIPIQHVMRHDDPAWNGRSLLVIGSLGSPGNFSSGMNSDGLAVADTASRTTDMGPGLHRYFLLTWLLVHCRSVAEALAAIRATTHTGSGLLLLGDAGGAVAAVELGHRAVGIETAPTGRVGRTNHFVSATMASRNLNLPSGAASRENSIRRHAHLQRELVALDPRPDAAAIRDLLVDHGGERRDGFCRHGGDDVATTIAGAIWDTGGRRLWMAAGNPCVAPWRRFDLEPGAPRAAAPSLHPSPAEPRP